MKKGSPYIDIDVTLGDNRLNENVVNHYNAQNQLIKTLTKNYKVSYTYDAEGLRTSKTVNGEKTVYVWDGDQLVLELSESGKVKKRYVRGNDLIFADSGAGTEKQYYVTDPHGSVVQLTDENGKVTKTYEYDSFGNEVKPDKKDENPFRYCGEYYDKETEEVYLRARYYQPKMGRFLTRDTYTGEEDEPASLHLYTYCGNDGVNSIDPSGHDAIWLQQTRGAKGFGHTAVSIQTRDKKRWCYFSFSSSEAGNILGNIMGIKGRMTAKLYYVNYKQKWDKYLIPKEYSEKSRKEIEGKISSLKAAQTAGSEDGIYYDKYIYLDGNSCKSYDYLWNKKKKIDKGKAKKYKLLSNNCKNMVVNALIKGRYLPPRTEKFKKILKKAKKKWIPNVAYKIVKDFAFSYPTITAVKK